MKRLIAVTLAIFIAASLISCGEGATTSYSTVTIQPTSTPTAAAPTPAPQPSFSSPSFYLTYRNGWDTPELRVLVKQFPSGIYEIHAGIEYENVPLLDEIVIAWYRSGRLEGQEISILSDGKGFIHAQLYNENGLPDGSYDLRVYYQGKVVQHGLVRVGRSPTVFPLAFTAEDVTQWSELRLPKPPQFVFPARTKKVCFVTWVANIQSGAVIRVEWYNNVQRWASGKMRWDQDPDVGWMRDCTYAVDGSDLPLGEWKVYVYLDDELARTGSFAIR